MTALIYKAALPTYTSLAELNANAGESLLLNDAGTAYELEPGQSGASGAIDFDNGVVIESGSPAPLEDFSGVLSGRVAPFDGLYDGEYGEALVDPDVLPATLGLAWSTDAALGDLVATEDGLWRVGGALTFAQDATGVVGLDVSGGGLSGGGGDKRYASDLSSVNQDLRTINGGWLVRLRAGETLSFNLWVYTPTATEPASICTYAAFAIHRIG